MAMSPIEEKDLILFNISAEEKTHVVKQYNRALLNSQRDGSDVAQIILKSLISQFPQWGDPALLFGICLAQEGQYKRAMSAFEYAVNNTLRSEQYLLMARDAMKAVKEDIENPPKKEESGRSGKNWTSVVAENNGTNERVGMHAPILVKASARPEKMGMASDRERRDIMMRSASGGDEMAGDDIDIENVRTPADNLRLAIKVVSVIIGLALIFVLVKFAIFPLVSKVKNSADTEERLDYLIGKLQENSSDPEVAGILRDYGANFSGGTASTASTSAAAEGTDATAEETAGQGAESEAATEADTDASGTEDVQTEEPVEGVQTTAEEASPEQTDGGDAPQEVVDTPEDTEETVEE